MKKAETGYIYLFQVGAFCKIGKSTNVKERSRQFSLPIPLVILHSFLVADMHGAELILHRHFKSKRTRGEWFNLSGEDIVFFLTLTASHPLFSMLAILDIPAATPKIGVLDEKLYTVKEIADQFRVSRQAIYDWINEGKLKALRLGDRIRVPESALKEFIRPVEPGDRAEEKKSGPWFPTPLALARG